MARPPTSGMNCASLVKIKFEDKKGWAEWKPSPNLGGLTESAQRKSAVICDF
jgi:hypothetical protein